MKLVSLVLFVIVSFVALFFGLCFAFIIPNVNLELTWVMGICLFIAGEIAVCTYIIVKAVEKLKK
ncbi:MAG: hypothetical protein ACM3X7_07255 [Solirubrobacterales bacterium]